MKNLLCSLIAFASLGLTQDQATTLAAACDRSDVAVLATVVAATDPSPEWHRLEWRTDERLAGQIGNQFTLLEPAGACCGRSLFALEVGQQRLLFLRRTGPQLHPFGGARGVVPPSADVLTHVRALLLADAPQPRCALLAASLDHPEPRIALDAAHALAAAPTLTLDSDGRRDLGRALGLAVQRGLTSAAPLLDAAIRTGDTALLDRALALYVQEDQRGRARLLRRGLSRVSPATLTARLPIHSADDDAQLRVAELLRSVPGEHGRTALATLLRRSRCPRVKLCATEGLLAAGTASEALRHDVPAPILNLAQQRVQKRRFRTIEPTTR